MGIQGIACSLAEGCHLKGTPPTPIPQESFQSPFGHFTQNVLLVSPTSRQEFLLSSNSRISFLSLILLKIHTHTQKEKPQPAEA